MKKVYYNIRLITGENKTMATIILREATDRMLNEMNCWVVSIEKKIKQYFGNIHWDYIGIAKKENCNKIILDFSRKNETFEL